ncbi:PREDICTED: UDP-glycosyltransferase 71B5-like [Camelina sativa]|uniref:Glycosyltransferase n=1 Tax=Camelina sativa TaxID=90675 RepID=A0ABM1RGK8_CAMSA|nr:PREDICTED: UDP-glycosyltransferase 71B5-like [Camelina sativa]
MTKIELVFIPSPGIGHLRPTVKLAKQLISRDDRLSITFIIIPPRNDVGDVTTYIASLTLKSQDRLRYEAISVVKQPPNADLEPSQVYIERQKSQVRDAISSITSIQDPTRKLAGFVVDMFCSSMIDVADGFGVPCYMIYTSNATFLGITLHVQEMYDEKKYDVSDLDESVDELVFPCLTRPYPVKCLPHIISSKELLPFFLALARSFRKMKGILVNTVAELEPHALKMFEGGDGDLPHVYPVGPVLDLENGSVDEDEKGSEILSWLDEQQDKSVVFLCFGSMGGFTEEQTREVAVALDRSGHRFLWSLRRTSPNIRTDRPGDFTDLEEVLPEGFLNRTSDRGKVIGWAPQAAVLAKPAIGGFVTHCGWNSMLESLWFGVPMVTWPLYAEQKVNAFEMVEELGLAVETRKCIRGDLLMVSEMETVTAEDIERATRCVMEQDSDVRKRVTEMAEKCRVALMDGGSSHLALQKFIQDVTRNVA